MNKPNLPATIAAYFTAKNRHDIDAMIDLFSDHAVVTDESANHKGRAAIKTWMKETTSRYAVSVEPLVASQSGEIVTVDGRVSGNFPGSPVTLTYNFKLSGEAIIAMEIS